MSSLKNKDILDISGKNYKNFSKSICQLLESARRQTARSVNAILTSTYWEIGRRIVEYEQEGKRRADYGEELLKKLSVDLIKRFGRGFGLSQLKNMRQFYLIYQHPLKSQSLIDQSARNKKSQSLPGLSKNKKISPSKLNFQYLINVFPLSWTHYIRLLRVADESARIFYETEALNGGWSVRQLDRQISSQFYERSLLSRNKAAMLEKDILPRSKDKMTPEEEIKDPYILEFLGLKDEYSENDLEEALIHHLESFLLELGGDFAFVARQKRLRVGNRWYRVDLVFYHRRLRCLVLIDLKIGDFSHADAGQMHLYCNYAKEHWTHKEENPPVGLILCTEKDHAVVKYALEGLPNKILASEYQLFLPKEKELVKELKKTRKFLELRRGNNK